MQQFRALVGSKAYGLDGPDSDTDIRGAYIEEPKHLFGIGPAPVIKEPPDTVIHPFRSFIRLCQKGAFTAIETLFSPLYTVKDPIFEPLFEKRNMFINITFYNAIKASAWAMVQEEKTTPKHFVQTYRLYFALRRFIETGLFTIVCTTDEKEILIPFKYEATYIQQNYRAQLFQAIEALDTSKLSGPISDYFVETFLINFYDRMFTKVKVWNPVFTEPYLKMKLRAVRRKAKLLSKVHRRDKETMNQNERDEFNVLLQVLEITNQAGYTPEVVWSALKNMKAGVNLRVALLIGLEEWGLTEMAAKLGFE